jgi:hypothetical protein
VPPTALPADWSSRSGRATGFLAETSPTFAAAPLPTERFNQALVGEDLVNYACQHGNKLPGSAG